MKRNAFIFLLLCVCMGCYHCSAQQYFNLRDPLHSQFAVLSTVVERSGKYYVSGPINDSFNYVGPASGGLSIWRVHNGAKFAVYDKGGHKLVDTFYQDDFENIDCFFSKLVPYKNGFLLSARSIDSLGNSRMMLLCFDTLGHVKWVKKYTKTFCPRAQNDFWQTADLKPDAYGNWLLVSTSDCKTANGGYASVQLTKLDSNFDVIWSKNYGSHYYNCIPRRIQIDSAGYLLAANYDNGNLVGQGVVGGPDLYYTDTAGAIKWHHTTSISKMCGVSDIVRTLDGGFVYCGGGSADSTKVIYDGRGQIDSYLGLPLVEKLDSLGNSVWRLYPAAAYGYAWWGLQNILQLTNGDFVSSGTLVGGWNSNDTADVYYGMLVCVSPDGKLKWRRRYTYGSDTMLYLLNDLKQTSDGGFIMCGEATASLHSGGINPIQRGWLLKVDSNGCASVTDPQCHPTAVPYTPFATAVAYQVSPNPVQELLNIQYSNNEAVAVFVLSDITGKTLCRMALAKGLGKAVVDMTGVVPGIYVYQIVSAAGALLTHGKLSKVE